jgi:hypothetical protein
MRLRLSAVSRSRKRRGGVVWSVLVHLSVLGIVVLWGIRQPEPIEGLLYHEMSEGVVSVGKTAATIPPLLHDDFVFLLPAPKGIGRLHWLQGGCGRLTQERFDRGIVAAGVLQFVVDTTGIPEEHSWEMVCADHPALERTMIYNASKLRFVPAQVEGRKVRRVALQHFAFVLTTDLVVVQQR